MTHTRQNGQMKNEQTAKRETNVQLHVLINVEHGLRQVELLANFRLVGEHNLNGGRWRRLVDDGGARTRGGKRGRRCDRAETVGVCGTSSGREENETHKMATSR